MRYSCDVRDCEAAKLPTVTLTDAEGNESIVTLPYTWEVCPVCRGNGTHVNPSIDSHGLTAEDFAADPDFRTDYFSGVYDQKCNHCNGRSTVPVIDETKITDPAQLEALEALYAEHKAESDYRAECMHERRMLGEY